ncbi:unnamed protein product [Sphenostylis stenocarpa]|uniref:uridine/cytidine kinase n=1 Tax=Sphenostylis stenocarpa TaxID=92480 RepID=A0AA86T412_9FABA|nr:unnamed protein product [Sphenostylis stenocarpa]
MIIQQLHDHRVVLVNQDSFCRGLRPEELEHVHEYNLDHPEAFDTEQLLECMGKLISGQGMHVPIYDFKKHQRSSDSFRQVNASDVIILEGILVFHDQRVRDLMNMKIFVDTDADVRLARRIRRDTVERGRDINSVLEQYAKFVKPAFDDFVLPSKKYADVIIPGGGDNHVAIDLIVQHIRTKLGQHDLCKIYPNVYVIQPSAFHRKTSGYSHRSCTKCNFDLCLICCRELRNGQLVGGADPIEWEFFFKGHGYLHAQEEKAQEERIKVEQNASNVDAKPEVREWSRSRWHAENNGSIACPKVNDECNHGFLELRTILGQSFITNMVHSANKLAHAYKLQDAVKTPEKMCSCLRHERNTDNRYTNTRKVASREDSNDNYLYCSRAVDLQDKDLRHFQWHWEKGELVIGVVVRK